MNTTIEIPTRTIEEFIRTRAPKALGGPSFRNMGQWLTSRADRGELAIIAAPDGTIEALGVATEQPDTSIHVELLIASRGWRRLLRAVQLRWPDWPRRTFTATRRGKFARIDMQRLIQRNHEC